MSVNIAWTDTTGAASLDNGLPNPGWRLGAWTPRDESIGPTAFQLTTGRIYGAKFRRDGLVSFEMRNVPAANLPLMLRLKLHLMKGGNVTLTTDNMLAERWATATLAPGTVPSITFADNVMLEYTFGVVLREAALPTACNGDLSGFQAYGDDFCPWDIAAVTTGEGVAPNTYRDSIFVSDQYEEIYNQWHDGDEGNPNTLEIVQTTLNGGHHALQATKYATDNDTPGVSTYGPLLFPVRTGFSETLSNEWARLRIQFSNNFVIPSDGSTPEFIAFAQIEGLNSPTQFDSYLIIGADTSATGGGGSAEALTGDLELYVQMKTIGGTMAQIIRSVVLPKEDLFDGIAKEIAYRAFDTGTGYRVIYKIRTAFSSDAWVTLYDDTFTYTVEDSPFTRAENYPMGDYYSLWSKPVTGASMWFRVVEWEEEDGAIHDDPFGISGTPS